MKTAMRFVTLLVVVALAGCSVADPGDTPFFGQVAVEPNLVKFSLDENTLCPAEPALIWDGIFVPHPGQQANSGFIDTLGCLPLSSNIVPVYDNMGVRIGALAQLANDDLQVRDIYVSGALIGSELTGAVASVGPRGVESIVVNKEDLFSVNNAPAYDPKGSTQLWAAMLIAEVGDQFAILPSDLVDAEFVSTPAGANVWIGGKNRGSTLLAGRVLPSALPGIRFSMRGHRDCLSQQIVTSILDSGLTRLECKLIPLSEVQ